MLPRPLSDEAFRQVHEASRHHEAREHQRRLMQGRGNPIMSVEHAGHRFVAVKNHMHWSKTWQTFTDFLLYYIKHVFGSEWGNAELQKAPQEQHPLIGWFTRVGAFLKENRTGPPGTIQTGIMSGAVRAYLQLAYDLYLIEHNAKLQADLIARLKTHEHFEGAVHEAHVAGVFAKAGFEIEMEDEADISQTHVEFIASHKESGKKFAVEAKAFTTASGKASDLSRSPTVRAKLESSLRKQTQHDRVVVIELARAEKLSGETHPVWLPELDAEIIAAEANLHIRGKPAPPAYLFVSNRSCVWASNEPASPEFVIAYGFKIPDFMPREPRSILDTVRARRKHAVAESIFHAYRDFAGIPGTFDSTLPEERLLDDKDSKRLRIGARYLFPSNDNNERTGVVVDALVMESWKEVVATVRHDDGSGDALYKAKISDEELAVYRASPDTFFGVVKRVSNGIQTPLEAFDFFYEAYKSTSRERLLELMTEWPNINELREMNQSDLVDTYCERWAAHMWLTGQQKKSA